MKRRLLKPPSNNGEILFMPDLKGFLSHLSEDYRIGVCHQPYFFHPGISLKFIFLDKLSNCKKDIIFLDTDKVTLDVKIPSCEGNRETVKLVSNNYVLSDYSTPPIKALLIFFNSLEEKLKSCLRENSKDLFHSFKYFKDIFINNAKKRLLKEVLAESFLQFYGIKRDYVFLSDLFTDKSYGEFFLKIYKDQVLFKKIFNEAIDEYREEFRFRYKNFPFPKLEEGEIPFWIIKDGIKFKCFKKDLKGESYKNMIIFPRAVTLTIFLRLYRLDIFIHGIGGGNYEWVQDRIIERFFRQTPPLYAIISGTFLLEGFNERDFPYFFYHPDRIKKVINSAESLNIKDGC